MRRGRVPEPLAVAIRVAVVPFVTDEIADCIARTVAGAGEERQIGVDGEVRINRRRGSVLVEPALVADAGQHRLGPAAVLAEQGGDLGVFRGGAGTPGRRVVGRLETNHLPAAERLVAALVHVGVANLPIGGVCAQEDHVLPQGENPPVHRLELGQRPVFVVWAGDHQPVGFAERGVAVQVEIGRVIHRPAALGGQFLQPKADEILVFEKFRRRRPVECQCLRGAADEVAGIEAVAAPLVVGLPGVGAQQQQDVSPLRRVPARLVGHHDIGNVAIPVAVGIVDEIERVIAGLPTVGGDVFEPGRPAGANGRRGDLHRLLADRDTRAVPDQLPVGRGFAGMVADAVNLDPAVHPRPVGTGGQHQVERLAGIDAVTVGIGPYAGAQVEAAPDRPRRLRRRLGRRRLRRRLGRRRLRRRRDIRRRAGRPQPCQPGDQRGKDPAEQRPAGYQLGPPPTRICAAGRARRSHCRMRLPRAAGVRRDGWPCNRSSQDSRAPSNRKMPYSAPKPISEP